MRYDLRGTLSCPTAEPGPLPCPAAPSQAMAEAKHARQRSPSGPPPLAPLGVLELGGASMQVLLWGCVAPQDW